jgi:hypothetical protein
VVEFEIFCGAASGTNLVSKVISTALSEPPTLVIALVFSPGGGIFVRHQTMIHPTSELRGTALAPGCSPGSSGYAGSTPASGTGCTPDKF